MHIIIHGLDSFNNFCAKVVKGIVSISIAAQILVIFCGAFWRYFLNSPLTWVDEMASLLLVVISFMGCYIALVNGSLARIELFIGKFKGAARRVVYVISELASLFLIIMVVIYGSKLFLLPTSLHQKTPGMFVPLWIFYGLIQLMFFLCAIASVTNILHYIFDKEGDKQC